jgi:hypothetical protein
MDNLTLFFLETLPLSKQNKLLEKVDLESI